MIRLWCFDLDGTLVDSLGDLTTSVNFMRKAWELPPLDREWVRNIIGDGRRTLLARALTGGKPFTEQDLDRLEALYSDYYSAHSCDRTVLFPGARETLVHLRARGGKLVLTTNKTASDARTILAKLGAAELFDRVIGDGEGLALKPEPDMLLAVMEQFAVPPAETVMVGDNHTDLGAARRAGVRAAFARYGYGVPRDEPVTWNIERFTDLETLS